MAAPGKRVTKTNGNQSPDIIPLELDANPSLAIPLTSFGQCLKALREEASHLKICEKRKKKYAPVVIDISEDDNKIILQR